MKKNLIVVLVITSLSTHYTHTQQAVYEGISEANENARVWDGLTPAQRDARAQKNRESILIINSSTNYNLEVELPLSFRDITTGQKRGTIIKLDQTKNKMKYILLSVGQTISITALPISGKGTISKNLTRKQGEFVYNIDASNPFIGSPSIKITSVADAKQREDYRNKCKISQFTCDMQNAAEYVPSSYYENKK